MLRLRERIERRRWHSITISSYPRRRRVHGLQRQIKTNTITVRYYSRRRLCRLIPRQFLGSTNFNVFNVQPPKKPGIVFSSTFFGPTTVTPMVAAQIVGDSGMTSLQTVDYCLVLSPSTHLQSNIGPSRARRAGHRSTARARTGRLPRLRSGPSPARRAPRAPAPTTPVHC